MKCELGCGKDAIIYVKSRRLWCCNKNVTACRATYLQCEYCKEKVSKLYFSRHANNCYLNPKNKKLCPICGEPIKNWQENITCSYKCMNVYCRSGENHPNYINGNTIDYKLICFQHHKKMCIICNEKLIVEAHHYDSNKENNHPTNFIPLCPTHHKYWHSKYRYIIRDKVEKYRNAFIKKFNGSIA